MAPKTDFNRIPTRQYAHPFDRKIRLDGDEDTHAVDRSPDAIGGAYGIGWTEVYRDHRNGQLYAVYCSDGVNHSKPAHSDRDLRWIEAMRKRIIDRTRHDLGRPIKLSTREWMIMQHASFLGWLDTHPTESFQTVGDQNRHLEEGEIGTINGLVVVVDPTYQDDLPPVGDFRESTVTELFPDRRPTSRLAEPTSRFGTLADALKRAGTRA